MRIFNRLFLLGIMILSVVMILRTEKGKTWFFKMTGYVIFYFGVLEDKLWSHLHPEKEFNL